MQTNYSSLRQITVHWAAMFYDKDKGKMRLFAIISLWQTVSKGTNIDEQKESALCCVLDMKKEISHRKGK